MVEAKQIKISTGSFLILLQSFFFGFGDPISKVAYEEMSVYSILAVRFSLAFVLMLLMGRRALVEDIRRSEVRVWIVPSLCLGSAYIAGNLALDFAPATSVAFQAGVRRGVRPSGSYQEGTGKSGSYGMWNHPRGHVWNVFVRPASS